MRSGPITTLTGAAAAAAGPNANAETNKIRNSDIRTSSRETAGRARARVDGAIMTVGASRKIHPTWTSRPIRLLRCNIMPRRAMIKKSLSNLRDSRSNPSGVKDIEPPCAAPGDLSSDPRWLLAQRVAQSELFRHSPRLRGFLLFVVERTLRNCTAELGEYEIGTRAFDRTADFNPADDSIVRSSARLLRTKLKEYFAGEGRQEPLLIEVPKE